MAEKKGKKEAKKFVTILSITVALLVIILGSYYAPSEWDKFPLKKILINLEENSINWRFQAKSLTSGNRVLTIEQIKTNYITNHNGTISETVYVDKVRVPQVKSREGFYNRMFIAAIEESTLNEYGRFPFDRKMYTNILDHFNSFPEERMPALVMFDILFDVASSPDSDKELAAAFKRYKGDVGEDFILDSSRNVKYEGTVEEVVAQRKRVYQKESLNYNFPKPQAIKRFELKLDKNFKTDDKALRRIFPYNKVNIMLPEIAEGLKFAGVANTDPGAVVRKKPLVFEAIFYTNIVTNIGGRDTEDIELIKKYYPSIILAMTVELLDSHLSNVIVKKGEVVIKNALVDEKRINYRIPVDDRFRLAINYKAPQGADYVRVIPLKDIKTISPNGLRKGSVFFVGLYALGTAHDFWKSPLGDMFGILHLSYALGTIMNRDFIHELPEWVNILYVALLTLAIGLLISRGIRSTMAGAGLAIVVPLVVGFVLFQFNISIVTVLPLISGVLALLTGVIYLLLTEEKEKRFIKSTFSSYVSPELVDILVDHPEMLSLGGQSKELTILFSDIRSFTTLSESMDPEYLINFLNGYLTKMTEIVMITKGTLDKYIGDAVMAFWGAPIELEDSPLKACQSAVKMMEALKEFNDERSKVGDKPIDIGIGMNTAVVNVGNVGSEQRKNYTVIGDGVNLASRLEGANKAYHTHIIISEFTYEKVKEHVIVRELDLMRVKGKHLPVRIYELLDVTKWD